MNTQELEARIVNVMKDISGNHYVAIMRRGKIVYHTTHNASAVDRYFDHIYNNVRPRQRSNLYTYKQALKALYTVPESENDTKKKALHDIPVSICNFYKN